MPRSVASIGASEPSDLRASALALLARREHSRAELRGKLLARGFDGDEVDAVLSRLQGEGLACDARFTEQYVQARTRRGYGPVRIRAELRGRGVDDEIIGRSLAPPEDGWQAHAERVRRQRFGERVPASRHERARQARFLEYRGFTSEQIGRMLREAAE